MQSSLQLCGNKQQMCMYGGLPVFATAYDATAIELSAHMTYSFICVHHKLWAKLARAQRQSAQPHEHGTGKWQKWCPKIAP